METLFTVGKLFTEQFSAPQTIQSTSVKSCSPLRGWKVSIKTKVNIEINKIFTNYNVALYFASLPAGSLEDWDVAVQKTETRLNRINEQRAKVRVHISIVLHGGIICLLLAIVTMLCPSVRWLRKKPTWLAKRRRELSSGGKPSRTRRLRRKSRRELDSGRRGKRSRMIIRTNGMTIQVR